MYRPLTLLLLAFALPNSLLASERLPSPYERAVQKTVTAWFAGRDLEAATAQLATDLGTLADTVQGPYGQLVASTKKLVADAAAGIAGFQAEGAVNFAVAKVAVDLATARSTIARMNTALVQGGQTPPAAVSADLTELGGTLDDLQQLMRSP